MKKVSLIGRVVCICLFLNSFVSANGIFISPGARAGSMGSAYVAVADDETGIYWNPAGLAQLEGSGVRLSSFYTSTSAKSNTSIKQVPAGSPSLNYLNNDFFIYSFFPTEPGYFNSKKFEMSALLPFAAGYKRINDITFAAGFYAVGGGGGKWEDTVKDSKGANDVYGLVDCTCGFMVGNISAGKYVSEKLSLGLGLNLIYMTDESTIKKKFISTVPLYNIAIETEASGTGLEVTGGLLYHAMDNLKLGFNIRTGAAVKLEGTAKYTQEGLSSFGSADTAFSTDYDQNYAYPMTYGIGAAYNPIKKLLLAAAIEFNDYSVIKEDKTYKTEYPGVFDNINANSSWDDTIMIRIGGEYKADDSLSLRAGIDTDPAPWPADKYLNLLNTYQYSYTTASIGAGYVIGNAKIDIDYGYSFSDEPKKDGRTYEAPVSAVRLDFGYNF